MKIRPRRFLFAALTLSSLGSLGSLRAVTATWTGAVSGDVGTPGNWTPITGSETPAYMSDLFFGPSSNVVLTGQLQVSAISSLTFDAGAPAYTYHVPYTIGLAVDGNGFTNDSGVTQTLSIDGGNATFQNMSGTSVLNGATIAVNGSTTNSDYGALYLFSGVNAGDSTITNNAGAAPLDGGGFTSVGSTATLANATVINNGGPGYEGYIQIGGSAGNATLIANGGLALNQTGGGIRFQGGSTAGTSTITVNGGNGSNSQGGGLLFQGTGTAANSTVTVNGGTNSGIGGYAEFFGTSTGGTAKFVMNSGSTLDIGQTDPGTTVAFGSVEGPGRIYLGGRQIAIGSLNTDTTISGIISDLGAGGQTGGALTKIGAGELNLTNADTYTGKTLVSAGTLAVNGSITSQVEVKSGATLKGTGTIFGAVTVDAGGIFSPGNSPGTITVQSLILNDTSVLDFELGTVSDRAIITASGGLTLDGVLNISDSGGFNPNTTYTLFTYTGAVTNNGIQIGSVPAGYSSGDFKVNVVGSQIQFTVVPEPSTAALVVSALGIGVFVRRRRVNP